MISPKTGRKPQDPKDPMSRSDTIASPSTRRLAQELGVDLDALASERGDPEVTRQAVLVKAGKASASGGAPAAVPPAAAGPNHWDVDHRRWGEVEDRPLSRIDKVAAANLSAASRGIPAVTHHDRADMTAVEALRKSIAEDARAKGVKLTALAFHVKALARTLRAFERFNASLSADGGTLHLKRYVSVGVAVDTPHGLMVPVVRDADAKGLLAIAGEIADLAGRAQARKLRGEETGGASMSISNLGGIGGRGFTPIVNPPEVAILGLTRATMEPIWDGEAFQPRLIVSLDLSYDHRVINGADAARFTAHYARLLEDPRRLLL